MVVRLGKVFYWLGVCLAALFGLIAIFNLYEALTIHSTGQAGDSSFAMIVCLGIAAACFLGGKGARYVLSNE
jgi:hypothetical protein